MRSKISRAMQDVDRLVVQFSYRDCKGVLSKESSARFDFLPNGRFLGLCLSREEPRQFYLNRCEQIEIKPAEDYLMPVPLQ